MSAVIIAAALSVSAFVPSSPASEKTPALGYSVSTLTVNSRGERIQRGATQSTVRLLMGRPSRELSPDIWIYGGYYANLDLANEQRCDTLVITFVQDKVADLKLVNKRAIGVIAANAKNTRSPFYASSKRPPR
jgi:hypothetical protein